MADLKQRIHDDMKTALKAGEKQRLGTIRLIMAAIKQREIDGKITADDTEIVAILEKMTKQRRESISQYQTANRQDLVDVEQAELEVIAQYMPTPLSEDELNQLINAALEESGASSMRDMGKVMGLLKPQIQGRADSTAVSKQIKDRLSS